MAQCGRHRGGGAGGGGLPPPGGVAAAVWLQVVAAAAPIGPCAGGLQEGGREVRLTGPAGDWLSRVTTVKTSLQHFSDNSGTTIIILWSYQPIIVIPRYQLTSLA